MDWSNLIGEFVNGNADAVQAIMATAGFIVAVIGTFYIVLTFRSQAQINASQNKLNLQQHELNRLAFENQRRQIRPIFVLQEDDHIKDQFLLTVENATAFKFTVSIADNFEKYVDIVDWSWPVFLVAKNKINFKIPRESRSISDELVAMLMFSDEDGRRYSQKIYASEFDCYISFPELIELPSNYVSPGQ